MYLHDSYPYMLALYCFSLSYNPLDYDPQSISTGDLTTSNQFFHKLYQIYFEAALNFHLRWFPIHSEDY